MAFYKNIINIILGFCCDFESKSLILKTSHSISFLELQPNKANTKAIAIKDNKIPLITNHLTNITDKIILITIKNNV